MRRAPDVDLVQVKGWTADLEALHERIGPRFGRVELRRRALAYVTGLLGEAERKNGWTLAEQADDPTPYGMQHLLDRARWDADGVRDELRGYVVEQLGEADAVLVVDETGYLKKGTRSVGVARQYTGTAGRTENAQVGVFLAYASRAGHALVDRELYLPQSWTDDPARCRAAGVPVEVGFRTKPQLAEAMLGRALAAEVRFGWVTGDTVYGGNPGLRAWLEAHTIRYVLAVKRTEPLHILGADGPVKRAAEQLVATVEAAGWLRLSAGQGAKGRRVHDWARLRLHRDDLADGLGCWLLVRRPIHAPDDPDELAFYVCVAPEATALSTLVGVAGTRWTVEECFQQAKGEAGMDHYQVRKWTPWYRHITLAMLAQAFLAVTRAAATTVGGQKGPLS